MSLDTVKVPTLEQLRAVAAELGFAFPEADLAAHHEALLPAFAAYNALDRMPDELPPVIHQLHRVRVEGSGLTPLLWRIEQRIEHRRLPRRHDVPGPAH